MDAKSFRRMLRKEQTSAESTFWNLVRASRFNKLKFRRQHTVGRFVADFYCAKLKLIIELDGGVHHNLGRQLYDQERDSILTEMGYVVIRFENDAVLKYPETVLAYLEQRIAELLHVEI